MKLSNREVEFINLVKPEYIGSRLGSSFAELKQAAEDYGLYAAPIGKLTSRELRKCHYPVILHVKFGPESQQYDHYILFLGVQDSQAKIFDPPNPVELVSFAELASLWDGNGMIVSVEPIDLGAVLASGRKRFILYSVIVILAILTVHGTKRFLPTGLFSSRIKLLGISVAQAGGFAVLALIIGMLYHFTNDEGLLANANATAAIQQAHVGSFIPKITERKVLELLDTDTIFIDARLARDFQTGHLEGAISLPVNSSDEERQKATSNIDKDARVVLYCQSSGCKYAERVAIKLIDDGFTDISIYKGGWAEWAAKNGKDEGTSS
jgi:rhodanese-related sulfurtransferase